MGWGAFPSAEALGYFRAAPAGRILFACESRLRRRLISRPPLGVPGRGPPPRISVQKADAGLGHRATDTVLHQWFRVVAKDNHFPQSKLMKANGGWQVVQKAVFYA